MIHYQLQCGQKHQFDGWFNDSGSFEAQAKRGLIACPECGRADIERALMAPALGKRGTREKEEAEPAPAVAATPEAPAPDSVAGDLSRMPARLRAELQKLTLKSGPKFREVKPKEIAILVVRIKVQPINSNNLARLLQSIEANVLKPFRLVKKLYHNEELLDRCEELKRSGMNIELKFNLDGHNQAEIALIQKVIEREASIRLFECEIECKGTN